MEHSFRLLDATLDGGLVEKISDWEPEARPVPDATLDGWFLITLLVARPSQASTERISDWEPVTYPAPDATLDGRLREGNTYLEHSALGVSLDSGLMEGMLPLELIE